MRLRRDPADTVREEWKVSGGGGARCSVGVWEFGEGV